TFSTLLASSSRLSVGQSILNSAEAANRHVQQWYLRFLRRTATSGEASAFTSGLLGGATDEQVISQILAADEYFNFGTILVTDPITVTTRYWVRATNSCGPADSNVAVLTVPQCTLPVIETQPKNVTLNYGETFSV